MIQKLDIFAPEPLINSLFPVELSANLQGKFELPSFRNISMFEQQILNPKEPKLNQSQFKFYYLRSPLDLTKLGSQQWQKKERGRAKNQ